MTICCILIKSKYMKRIPIILAALSTLLVLVGAMLKIMSYGGANALLMVGVILVPVSILWATLVNRDKGSAVSGYQLSAAESFVLGVAEERARRDEATGAEDVRQLPPPAGLQPEDLVRAYILLKDKGLLVEDKEDTAELLNQLQREKRKDLR